MIAGKNPFKRSSEELTLANNYKGIVDFEDPSVQEISVEERQVLKDLLELEPNNRKSLKELLKADFFTQNKKEFFTSEHENEVSLQNETEEDQETIQESGRFLELEKGEIRVFSSPMFKNSPFANKNRRKL